MFYKTLFFLPFLTHRIRFNNKTFTCIKVDKLDQLPVPPLLLEFQESYRDRIPILPLVVEKLLIALGPSCEIILYTISVIYRDVFQKGIHYKITAKGFTADMIECSGIMDAAAMTPKYEPVTDIAMPQDDFFPTTPPRDEDKEEKICISPLFDHKPLVPINHYTMDDVQFKLNVFFRDTLPRALRGKLIDDYINIYIQSLRINFNVSPVGEMSDEQMMMYRDTDGYLAALYKKVDGYDSAQLAEIVRVIQGNTLSYVTSPNVFNLLQTEPEQQNALNIKRITSTAAESAIDDRVIRYDNIEQLKAGRYYIPDAATTTINMSLHIDTLKKYIKTDTVFAFKINSNSMDTLNVNMALRNDVYEKFKKLKCTQKKSGDFSMPLQYRIVGGEETEDVYVPGMTTTINYKTFCKNTWQCGDDYIFNLGSFSSETMKGSSKRFEIYGIFCPHSIQELIEKTKCTFYIRRIIQNGPFIFYYCRCFILLKYKYDAFTFMADYGRRKCLKVSDEFTMNQKAWCLRTCFHLIYHTHFQLENEASKLNPEMYTKMMISMQNNLINFRYISTTGCIDMYPRTQSEGCALANTIILVSKNIARDFAEKNLSVTFRHFNTKKDGPFVAVNSIRTCEKLADASIIDKYFPLQTTAELSLVNHVHATGPFSATDAMIIE